jgi:C-terminal processing protease CtpA/Prc
MKKLIFALIAFSCITAAYAQSPAVKKYSPQQLKDDAEFLKKQLFDAHADPFTEINKGQYEQMFADIEAKLTDSLNATEFYKRIKPVFSYLSDEHSGITLDTAAMDDAYAHQPVFLPLNLTKTDKGYFIDDVLNNVPGLAKGDQILSINGVPIAELIEQCAHYTTGFPGQRHDNALKQFGYLYTWWNAAPQQHYKLSTNKGDVTIDGVTIKKWLAYLNISTGDDCPQLVSYTRYGDAGYIDACSFMTHSDKEFKALSQKIDSLFALVKKDGVKYLFIDVSHNSGGNSSVGDVLINYFSVKPYRTYQCNWRRSDEYLALITKWGIKNEFYESKTPGSVIHFDPDTISPQTDNANRFAGKVYIMVGGGTFSSAMMFATIVKDNYIATLIGQTPQNGHPDHFGELYNAKLPNTGLAYRFGVKEWIRPAGKMTDNYLRPDMEIDPEKYATVEQIIGAVKK